MLEQDVYYSQPVRRLHFPTVQASSGQVLPDSTMTQERRIHWLAPVSMLAALTAGILLALGHHLFYRRLNGTETPTDDLRFGSLSYSKQQLNIQVGTAFAFLVKASLVVSVSIAYAQVFWGAFPRSYHGKPPTLSNVDTAFSALGNVLALFNFPVWLRNPVLLSLATLTW